MDLAERKGSLFMRSDHMNYSKGILNQNWYQAREAEPKDYDLSHDPVRDLTKSTYLRISRQTNGELPRSTYQDMAVKHKLRNEHAEKYENERMINEENAMDVTLDRDTDGQGCGIAPILPRHPSNHNKRYLETTQRADYTPPYPYQPIDPMLVNALPDETEAFKRCRSQFTDVENDRRAGRNTWQDESGHYTNAHYKLQVPVLNHPDPIVL